MGRQGLKRGRIAKRQAQEAQGGVGADGDRHQDRDAPGQGFTHHPGDVVTISEPSLGALVNIVRLSTECPPWEFGAGALMRNLAGRGLLGA